MKLVYLLLFSTSCAYAQVPATAVRRDSLPSGFSVSQMPIVGSNNSFYRSPTDPKNVVRATLDNMPIKVPDSSTNYTMMRSYQLHANPQQQPQLFLEPLPKIIPKKFK
ncbi:hypothetical protein [Spirosoma litoris]